MPRFTTRKAKKPGRKPASPRAPRKASKKRRGVTAAGGPRTTRPGSLAERLAQPFALTDCRRIVALAEMWSEQTQKKAAANTRKKVLVEQRETALKAGDKRKCEQVAEQIMETIQEASDAKAGITASINDLIQITLEVGDGASIWAAAQAAGKEAEDKGQAPIDENQFSMPGVSGEGEPVAPAGRVGDFE